ncbi:ATP-binding protein [Nonomuraea sp. SYSU D8015]|uniref:ATP-binding protein n=1 Tax=Nonomuraea sp. SYSU D8015 TaxID=2593644 RepID=UPI001660944C|nr:helix-turn-helix domain-containing protein [Nonomuraea sp. SYSU D8015]
MGTLVRAWRERALLTQEQLAQRAGLNVRTIRRMELGTLHRPRGTSVSMLAEALNLDTGEQERLFAAARGVPARPARDGSESVANVPPNVLAVPRQLPPGAAHFVGRRKELSTLDAILSVESPDPRVMVIVGCAGIGKTTLAVQWCSAVAGEFPDGQLYVNLRGFGTLNPVEPASALNTLLRGMGVAPEEIPEDQAAASALFRTRTAGRRLLILLDNALNSEQVRPLLPARGCVAVVTSRDQLRSLTTHEATTRISLSPLEPPDSAELLSRISGRAVTGREEPVRDLMKLCDNSPLALRIIGERLARQPDVPLLDLVDELAGGHEGLDAFSGGDDAYSDLRTVLSWSYRNLPPETAWVLRAVGGLYPGADFCTAAASALAGLPVRRTRQHLDRLVSTHLVEQHGGDRFSLHDLVRAYAAEESRRNDTPSAREAAVSRLLTWFIHCLYAADAAFAPDRMREPMVRLGELEESIEPVAFSDLSAALRWCEREHQTITALPAWAHAHGAERAACQIAYLLESFLAHYKHYHELLDSHKAVLQIDDLQLRGHLLSAMGNASDELLRSEDADRYLHHALRAFRECGDRRGEAKVLSNLAANAIRRGKYHIARTRCEQALAVAVEAGYLRGRAHTLDTLGEAHFGLGDYESAIECWRLALDINRRSGAHFVQATNLTNVGRAYSASGHHESAIEHHREAIAMFREIESLRGEAMALLNLGSAYHAQGAAAEAKAAWLQAWAMLSELGDAKAAEAWALGTQDERQGHPTSCERPHASHGDAGRVPRLASPPSACPRVRP